MYSIPVSISDATAQNPTSTLGAGTVINFGAAANVRGDVATLENTTDQRPTATSSASTGGPAASETRITPAENTGDLTKPILILAVTAVIGIVLFKVL